MMGEILIVIGCVAAVRPATLDMSDSAQTATPLSPLPVGGPQYISKKFGYQIGRKQAIRQWTSNVLDGNTLAG
jgi:hypothetical protein